MFEEIVTEEEIKFNNLEKKIFKFERKKYLNLYVILGV